MLVLVFKFPTSERLKSSETASFQHFWLANGLRATTAGTFQTSQLPKVFYILTASALRHNGVFFSTTQRPELVWSWGASGVWLQNVFGATVPCTFSISPLPKGAQSCGLFNIFTSKSACGIRPNGSALPALGRLCTFQLSWATKDWTNTVFCHRLLHLIARLHLLSSDSFCSLIFFLLPFSSLTLSTSAFSIFTYCRKFDF